MKPKKFTRFSFILFVNTVVKLKKDTTLVKNIILIKKEKEKKENFILKWG